MTDTEKLPVVCDDFVVTARASIAHIGFFARLAPYGAKGEQDEEKICVARVALTAEGVEARQGALEQLKAMLLAGPALVN